MLLSKLTFNSGRRRDLVLMILTSVLRFLATNRLVAEAVSHCFVDLAGSNHTDIHRR